MTIKLIHVHQLETLYQWYGSKINLGSFGVAGVKRSFSAKMLLLLQNTWYYLLYVTVYPCYHVTHKYALTWDSELHSLVQGQLGITSPTGYAVCDGNMFLVLSFFTLPVTPAGSCFSLVSSFFILPAQPQDLVSYSFLLSSSFFFFFFFFLLATHLFHTLPYIWFWPNLLTVTGTLTTTHTLKMVGSGVTMGSLGSKRSFAPKRHQVLQIT